MSTVINTNSMATRTANIYNRNNAMMNGALTRLATQQRINSAKDNASTYAISERMRERIRANDQANRNSQNDAALLKTAQGGLDKTLEILTTLRERAVDSANDSNVNLNRAAIVTEVQSLVQQIDTNANSVKFNGRTLLNGATDSTSATSGGSGVTATDPVGSAAVYSITNLKEADTTNGVNATKAAASTTKLIDLVDSSGKKLFSEGDKITLSWRENGTDMSASTVVTSSNKVEDLAMAGSLSKAWVTAGNSVNASIKDENFDVLKAGSAGLYFYGADKTVVTNMALSVTPSNSSSSRASAVESIRINAVQQSYGAATGSNVVFSTAATAIDTSGTGLSFTSTASIKDLGIASAYNSTFKVTVDGKSAEVNGNATLEELNAAVKELGIQFQIADKGEVLKYDGAEVTRGENQTPVKSALTKGLFIIGEAGKDISSITLSGNTANPTTKVLGLASGAAGSAGSALLPQGDTLTFFVGGEANFGVNFAIGKATAANLLGSGASSFATRFGTSSGAQSALSIIDNAITKTLNEQARLGSMESRMGYISDNLTTMNENLQAADSVLRDTDPAKEMANYMKYMVMSQAAQYMMVQANQNAFQVANLLQP